MIRPVQQRLLLSYGAIAAVLACTACSGPGSDAAPALTSAAASSPIKPFDAPPDAATIGDTVADQMKMWVAIHVKGGDDRTTKLDLQINHDSAGGSIEKDGVAMPMLRVGDKVWIKFSKGLAKAAGQPAGAYSAVDGKWVSTDSPMARVFREALKHFLDLDVFVDTLIDDLDRPGYSAAEPVDLAGTPAVRYRNGSRTIYLEHPDSSYSLVRYESPKQGTLDFSGSGPQPFQAPPAAEIYSGPGS
ncbi:hypothetical protein [Amycolatopsis sp. NPDC054798]